MRLPPKFFAFGKKQAHTPSLGASALVIVYILRGALLWEWYGAVEDAVPCNTRCVIAIAVAGAALADLPCAYCGAEAAMTVAWTGERGRTQFAHTKRLRHSSKKSPTARSGLCNSPILALAELFAFEAAFGFDERARRVYACVVLLLHGSRRVLRFLRHLCVLSRRSGDCGGALL